MRSLASSVVAVALGCGSPLSVESVPISQLPAEARVFYGANSGICVRAGRVVRTADEWASTWAALVSNRLPAPATPAVDFSAEMLLVATIGMRPTGGYAVDVERAEVTGGTLTAYLLETSPGRTCLTTQGLTCPATVVRVARRDEPVEFVARSAVLECAP